MSSSSLEQASKLVPQSPAAARQVTSNGVPAASVAIGSIVPFPAVKKEDGEEEEIQFVGVFKKTGAPQKKNGQQRQNHHHQQQQQQQQKKDPDPKLPAVSIPLRLAAGEVLDDPRLDLPYVCGRLLTSVYRPAPRQQQQQPQQLNLREHLRQLQRRFFLDPRLNGQDKS